MLLSRVNSFCYLYYVWHKCSKTITLAMFPVVCKLIDEDAQFFDNERVNKLHFHYLRDEHEE